MPRRRKSNDLHAVQGTFRADRHAGGAEPRAVARDNFLEPPRPLRGRQAEIWDRHIRTLPGLIFLDTAKAHLWTELFCEFEADPARMSASRINLLRLLGKDLQLGGTHGK